MTMDRRKFVQLTGLTTAVGAAGWAMPSLAAVPDLHAILDHVAPELRPAAEKMLTRRGMPKLTEGSLVQVQKSFPGAVPFRPDVPVSRQLVPVAAGAPDVPVYVVNAKPGERRPAILHTHGGGFILGSAAFEVPRLQTLASALDCTIVTVDYRLAPAARYRDSVEETYAGLRWLFRNAAQLGVDPRRIALMGESAGGGHAALLAFAARDRGEVPVIFQLLVYPMLDDRTGSTRKLPDFYGSVGWKPEENRLGWGAFLGMEPGTSLVPTTAVPARRSDLAGLPPTFIGVGGIDLFASEDIDFSRRLLESGVPVELAVVPGAFHGFDVEGVETGLAKNFNEAKMRALRRAFFSV